MSDRRLMTLGAVLDLLTSQNSRAIIFFPLFFILCSPANSAAVLPLIELLHVASHSVDNKFLFLKIGGAAES